MHLSAGALRALLKDMADDEDVDIGVSYSDTLNLPYPVFVRIDDAEARPGLGEILLTVALVAEDGADGLDYGDELEDDEADD